MQPFIPRSGIQEAPTMETTSLVAGYWCSASHCYKWIKQRHIRTQTLLLFQFNWRLWLVPEVTGQAPRKLAPCPLRKQWALPSWWKQSNLGAHSQAHEIASQHRCPSCVPGFETSLASWWTYWILSPACRPLGRAALAHRPYCHYHRGGYQSQVGSVGITVGVPKSLKWNLHKESSDGFRMVRANSLEL